MKNNVIRLFPPEKKPSRATGVMEIVGVYHCVRDFALFCVVGGGDMSTSLIVKFKDGTERKFGPSPKWTWMDFYIEGGGLVIVNSCMEADRREAAFPPGSWESVEKIFEPEPPEAPRKRWWTTA